jgi:type IX secretion system PorP/SprF family membrane protein
MVKNWIVVILFILLSAPLFAQQDPVYNQYMFNPLVVNPAYAGSRDVISTVFLHRSQWVGVDGAPNTQSFSIHSPFAHRKLGLGFNMVRDQFGPYTATTLSGSYAYRLNLSKGKLAFGIRTTAINYTNDWSKVEYRDINEEVNSEGKTMFWLPSFDFGLRYHTRTFYAGITFLNLNNPTLKFNTSSAVNERSSLARHFNLTLGNAFEINKDFVFKPSMMLKMSDKQNLLLDVNFSALYKQAFWFGFSLRSTKAVVIILEYNISDKFRAGYSYDFSFSKLMRYNTGSHEIFLGFDIAALKKKPAMLSPRNYF